MKCVPSFFANSLSWLSKKYKMCLILCSLALLISLPLASARVQGPTIEYHIEPQNLTVREGDIFNVSVLVENIPDNPGLAGAEFHLSWNPTVLNALSMIKVMFHDNSIGWDGLNNTEGTLSYVHSLCGGSIGGNQTLAIITLEAIAEGSTTLHFTFVDACSPYPQSFNCRKVDCNLTVGKGTEASPQIVPNNETAALYTMSILAGSVNNADTLVLPPAVATENVPFSVDIEIDNITDMKAWQFGLFWNRPTLNCTNVEIHNPSWKNTISIGGEINNNFDSTHGYYFIAVAAVNADPYNGNITIAKLTFNPLGAGTTPLTFDNAQICNKAGDTLELSTTTGSVTVYEGQPSSTSNTITPEPSSTNIMPEPSSLIDSTPTLITTSNSTQKPTTPIEGGQPVEIEQTVHAPKLGTISVLMIPLAALGILAVRRIRHPRDHAIIDEEPNRKKETVT